MKKNIIIVALATLLAVSCDSYLDRQPDEPYTSKNVLKIQFDFSLSGERVQLDY